MTHQTAIQPGQARILHVIAHMEKGGAERQLMLLTEHSRHHNVIMVLSGNERPASVAVETLPGLRNPFAVKRFAADVIRRHGIDIVQLWLPDRMTVPAMWAARAAGCTILSGDRRRVRNHGRGAVRDRVSYLNHVAADLVIPNYPHLPPPFSLRRLLRIPRKTYTILNGLALTPRPPSVTKHPDRLLFVGRLVEQKRVGELIDTLPALIEQAGISGLDIVGTGHLEDDYRSRIRTHGLEDRVTLHGHLSNWGERFAPDNTMLILPSTSEGMSNTVFEAIAWGFMPLVSQSPELDVILHDWVAKPALFDPWQPDSIVAATKQVLQDSPAQIEARIRAMQNRLDDFSVSRMVASYDLVYDRFLSQRRAA